MGTDPEPSMRNKADQQLVEIDKKYTGFIHVSRASAWLMVACDWMWVWACKVYDSTRSVIDMASCIKEQ